MKREKLEVRRKTDRLTSLVLLLTFYSYSSRQEIEEKLLLASPQLVNNIGLAVLQGWL